MSRLIFIIQEKGGEGKTCLAIHLAHFLRTLGHKFQLADIDYEDRLLSIYDPGCTTYSPDPEALKAGNSNVLDLAFQMSEGTSVLIDCGANTLTCWEALFQLKPKLLPGFVQTGVQITLIVPVSDDRYAQQCFETYDAFFAAGKPTKLLASIGAAVRQTAGFPAHPEELMLTMPRLPQPLAREVKHRGLPAGVLATKTTGELGFPVGFAKNADRAFADEFKRLLPFLTP